MHTTLGGTLPSRQSSYKLPICKVPILPPPQPKPPDMPVDTFTPAY